MERYEAILEQLRKAQDRGLETITNRLDFVVQSLEELIQEAKSSVQGALPESADEFLPLSEVLTALEDVRNDAEQERRRADTLEARLVDLESGSGGGGQGLPLGVLRTLDGARSQSELLRELLPILSDHAARAVVLVLRDGSVSAWSGIGFTDGELLRGWQGKAEGSRALVTIQDSSSPVMFSVDDDELFSSWLGDESRPSEAMLIPVVLRSRMMGAVYVDRLDGQPWNPSATQTLVMLVCLLIDTLASRSGPAAMLAEAVTVEPAAAAPFGAAFAEDVGDEAESEASEPDPSATVRIEHVEPDIDEAAAEAEPPQAATFEPAEPELESPSDEEPETVEPGFFGTPETFEPEIAEPEVSFEAEPAAPVPEFEVAEVAPEEPLVAPAEVETPVAEAESAPPSGFMDEPPPVRPVQPPPDEPKTAVPEDNAQREEAKRFARLLISEIKLYNEEQVERGREAKDIYRRLQEDIDRSREMFEKRISSDIRARKDYFKDELVRILADGDPDLLGM